MLFGISADKERDSSFKKFHFYRHQLKYESKGDNS